MIGFIGTGNMAAAIIEGAVKAGVMPANEILIDKNRSRAGELHNSLNVKLCDDFFNDIRLNSKNQHIALQNQHPA